MRLVPKNWSSFQHYKDRSPSWIKLHKALLDDYEFQCLPVASRALAPMLWLLASEEKDGIINASAAKLAFRLRMTETEFSDALKPLINQGFFDRASDALADCKRESIPEKETYREEEEEERDLKVSSPPQSVGPSLPVQVAFDEFCQVARECGLAVPSKLTASRRSSMQVRLREHGIDGWRQALTNIRGSPFLLGDNQRGWKADLDFVLQAKSFNRLLEGGYSGSDRNTHEQSVEHAIAAGFAAYSQRVASGGD